MSKTARTTATPTPRLPDRAGLVELVERVLAEAKDFLKTTDLVRAVHDAAGVPMPESDWPYPAEDAILSALGSLVAAGRAVKYPRGKRYPSLTKVAYKAMRYGQPAWGTPALRDRAVAAIAAAEEARAAAEEAAQRVRQNLCRRAAELGFVAEVGDGGAIVMVPGEFARLLGVAGQSAG